MAYTNMPIVSVPHNTNGFETFHQWKSLDPGGAKWDVRAIPSGDLVFECKDLKTAQDICVFLSSKLPRKVTEVRRVIVTHSDGRSETFVPERNING